MASPQVKPRLKLSVEIYLAGEQVGVERREYLEGESYAMAGEKWAHGSIFRESNAWHQEPAQGQTLDTPNERHQSPKWAG